MGQLVLTTDTLNEGRVKINEQINNWFNVETYGAVHDGVTDDTVAIQAAITACYNAGGGTVYFPYSDKQYIIGGALITSLNSVNPNCQLYYPLCDALTSMIYIELLGGTQTNMSSAAITGISRNIQGVVLESTISGSGTFPCVIGSPYKSFTSVGNRNYTYLDMKNITVRTKTKSGSTDVVGTMSAVNAQYYLGVTLENVKFDITSRLIDSVNPTNETYGIILPAINNKAILQFKGVVFVEGYKYGIVLQEHLVAEYIIAAGCVSGLLVDRGFHSIMIKSYLCEAVAYNINCRGEANVIIEQFDTEHFAEGKWYDHVYDVYFPTVGTVVSTLDYLRTRSIHIKHFAQVTPSVGVESVFLTNSSDMVFLEAVNGVNLNQKIQSLSGSTWNTLLGKKAKKTASANATITISNKFINDHYELIFVQDGTGGRTLTIDGVSVTLPSTTASTASLVSIEWDGTSHFITSKLCDIG